MKVLLYLFNFEIKMIQRIQSLYLSVVLLLLIAMQYFPIIIFTDKAGIIYQLKQFGYYKVTNSDCRLVHREFLLLSLIFISSILTLFAIFLFKKRKTQIKFCNYIIFLMIVLIFLIIYIIKADMVKIDTIHFVFSWPSVIPVISIILAALAKLSINKDDELIKSIDRIR